MYPNQENLETLSTAELIAHGRRVGLRAFAVDRAILRATLARQSNRYSVSAGRRSVVVSGLVAAQAVVDSLRDRGLVPVVERFAA